MIINEIGMSANEMIVKIPQNFQNDLLFLNASSNALTLFVCTYVRIFVPKLYRKITGKIIAVPIIAIATSKMIPNKIELIPNSAERLPSANKSIKGKNNAVKNPGATMLPA
jgi:hypothetical protein